MSAGTPHPRSTPSKKRSGRLTPPARGVCRRTDALPAPSPRRPRVVPPQPRLTSPPLGVVGGRGAPEALPSLLPPSSPHPGEGRYNLWLQLYTSEKKKKSLQNVPHRKKKKIRNRAKKTCEWAWRMGLLKLRRSRGSPSHSASLRESSRARPARPPAPWTSEQVGAWRPRPWPPPPPGSREIRFPCLPREPRAGAGLGSRELPPPAGLGPGEAPLGALERGRAGTRHS